MTSSRLLSLVWSFAGLSLVTALSAVALEAGGEDAGLAQVADAGSPAPEPDGGSAADKGSPGAEEDAFSRLDDAQADVPSRETAPPIATVKPLAPQWDLLARARRDPGGKLVLKDGEVERRLTINAAVQDRLEAILRSYETPYAAVVALEPSTGRVLAMAEHSQANPALRGLPVKAVFPAASIFKLVTATALLDRGLSPDTSECTHGGKRRVTAKHLEDTERDRVCMSLSNALALSANGVFAKLTYKNLSAPLLKKWAEAFRFNRALKFALPAEVSLAAFPADTLALAQTGAGFGDVYLSPLHGAALAAIAANHGLWRDPILFEDEQAAAPERVMAEGQAAALTSMMEETVKSGTARRIFRERGFRVPGAVGKTGSLADKRPFRDYSWFVGFAPKDDPQVAVAAVIVNDPMWRIRATWLGREAMRLYLEEKARTGPTSAASR